MAHSISEDKGLTRPKAALYLALLVLDVLLKLCGNVFAWGSVCTGTGAGGNHDSLRLCVDKLAFFYPFILDFAILLVIALISWRIKSRHRFKALLVIIYICYLFVSSLFVWNLPFFMEPIH